MVEGEEIEVGTFEAKNRLSALIDEAVRGRRIWITRHGKRVALLSSGIAGSVASGPSLVEEFRRIRRRAKAGGESLKDLVEEGRR
jgi:prevent-host-death family protein